MSTRQILPAADWRALPEPIRILPRGGPCSLRSFDWGQPFTPAEQAAHAVARKRWRDEGGVPNVFESDEAPEPPQPWLGVRRVVAEQWHEAFGNRRPAEDRESLLSHVLVEIATAFTPERIRKEPGRVVRFAERVVKCELADLTKGIRRKRAGLLSIVNDRRLVEAYADAPTFTDDENGGEERATGATPSIEECDRAAALAIHAPPPPTEAELIAAIDARAAGVGPSSLLAIQEIDVTGSLFSKLWGSEWTSLLGSTGAS